jgi:hypothetical protein
MAPHTREGTINEKVKVIALRNRGLPFREIAEQTTYSKSGAQKVFKIWEDEERLETKNSQRGRNRAFIEEQKDEIEEHVRDNPWNTLEEITEDLSLNVVPHTVEKVCLERELPSRAAEKVEKITPEHKRKRLEWCRERRRWTKTRWRKKVSVIAKR